MALRALALLVLFVATATAVRADEANHAPSSAPGAAQLIMFEAEGCSWCARWNEQIGPIYPKTDEGRVAPLRRVDLDMARPADLAFVRGVVFTPTFVLVRDGREVGRIVGYPGEEFFWPLLDDLLLKLEATTDSKS